MIIYLVMVLGTLRHLTDLAGVLPFDLRPTGYSQVDAEGLLEALGESGRQYYLTRQIPLDTLYPALLALTLMSTLRWRAFRFGPTLMTRIGGALAHPGRGLRLPGKPRDKPHATDGAGSAPCADTGGKHSVDPEIRSDVGCHTCRLNATLVPIWFQRLLNQPPMKSARRSSRLS